MLGIDGAKFGSSVAFILALNVASAASTFDDVWTKHFSQWMNALAFLIISVWGWKLMPSVPPACELKDGKGLLTQGFRQIFRTVKGISRHYRRSLGWYFLVVLFANAGD